jgi:N-acetyl-gamma-glutamyl-phosphate reductase
MGYRVAVAGASGYAGGELLRLLAIHPDLDIVAATAGESAGQTVGGVHPGIRSLAGLRLVPTTPEVLRDADLVMLALPHGESARLAAQLGDTVHVVDLAADHRLADPAVYARYYTGDHPGQWIYGLPELPGQRQLIAGARRVANTGCYAVAVVVALAPLIAAGLVDRDDVVVVAASGTTGAGRSAKTHLLASEVISDLSPYRVGVHQHVPEIKQATGATTLSMTPVLAPMPRGILATVTARPARAGLTVQDVRDVLEAAYGAEPFVHLLADGLVPHTAATFGSNAVHLQAHLDADSGRVIVTSAIDNLGKGAAGQAIQNANLMLGLPETTGLSMDGVAS